MKRHCSSHWLNNKSLHGWDMHARWTYTARLVFLAWYHKIKDHLVGVLSYIINPSLTKLVRSFFLCVCLWTSTLPRSINTEKITWPISSHLKNVLGQWPTYMIKITINDDDNNNNDTPNNILTSWNLSTSWLLRFLLVHCWITLTASTTSAFVKLSPPWFWITLRSLSWLNAACFNTVWCAEQDRF